MRECVCVCLSVGNFWYCGGAVQSSLFSSSNRKHHMCDWSLWKQPEERCNCAIDEGTPLEIALVAEQKRVVRTSGRGNHRDAADRSVGRAQETPMNPTSDTTHGEGARSMRPDFAMQDVGPGEDQRTNCSDAPMRAAKAASTGVELDSVLCGPQCLRN